MTATTRASARRRRVGTPTRVDPAAAAHLIRDHVAALEYALHSVRLVAGAVPGLETALALADRQAKALTQLADALHDPVKETGDLARRTK